MPVQLNGADLITSFGDYETGVFTPTIMDDSNDGSGESQTYSVQVGGYTKVGNMVSVQGRILISSLGCLTTSQGTRIGGLPFVAENTTNLRSAVVIGAAGSLSIPAEASIVGFIVLNEALIRMNMYDTTGGTSSLLLSELTDGGDLTFQGTYKI